MTKDEIIAELRERLEAEPDAIDKAEVKMVKLGYAYYHVLGPTMINSIIELLEG